MGRHKNPITLKFLGLLRERGAMYDFSVEEEYPLVKGTFFADIVYMLPKYNEPIISFEVESSPTSYVIKKAVKYFGTNSTEVPKPWHHFIIILNGTLRPSDKKSLELVTKNHNVHVFENVLIDKEEHKKFDAELRKMAEAFKQIEEGKNIVTEFRIGFSTKIKQCIALIEQEKGEAVTEAIDELIMLFKERIEKWDVPSVGFASRELFEGLYKYSSRDRICEIYEIFKDLFRFAHSQRKQLMGAMIAPFFDMLLEAWVKGYDIEKGEQACKVMLRLGIDFLEADLSISEDCIHAIDNLAGDMFEPEILSKEILFCAVAYQKSEGNAKLQDFVEQYSDWIKANEEYSWDDETRSYLRDSIEYAEGEQHKYDVDIESYKNDVLIPIFNGIIDSEIEGYAQFLQEDISESSGIAKDTSFEAEDLSKMILAYESYRPNFAFELRRRITQTDKKNIITLFDKIVRSSNFLTKIYTGSDMISTFDELINFLEKAADKENLGVGLTTYSIAIIDFRKKLNPTQKSELEGMMREDGLDEFLEVTDESITFEVDSLVYSKESGFHMEKLIKLLKDVNSNKISSFSSGITFGFRDI
jgi:hypothetical protein